jgi:hypothetical protein
MVCSFGLSVAHSPFSFRYRVHSTQESSSSDVLVFSSARSTKAACGGEVYALDSGKLILVRTQLEAMYLLMKLKASTWKGTRAHADEAETARSSKKPTVETPEKGLKECKEGASPFSASRNYFTRESSLATHRSGFSEDFKVFLDLGEFAMDRVRLSGEDVIAFESTRDLASRDAIYNCASEGDLRKSSDTFSSLHF